MIIPTTGLVFLFGAFVFLYLSWKFYRCYKDENNRIAGFFSLSFLLIGLNYIVSGVPALLLIESHDVWKVAAPVYSSLTIGGWLLLGYAVISGKFPRYGRIIGSFFIILFLVSVSSVFFREIDYYYVDGALSWSLSPVFPFEYVFFVPFAIVPVLFLPLFFIFLKEARSSLDKMIKIRSLGFCMAMGFLFLGLVIDVALLNFSNLHPVYSDFNYLVVFTTLALSLIFTWFPPKPKWLKRVE